MPKAPAKTKRSARDPYLDLIRRLPLRPLRNDDDLSAAIEFINSLLDRWDLEPSERDYLDVLSDLVAKYEQEHHPIPPATDGAMLRFLLELRDLTQADLARQTGIAQSTVSAVLSGKRELNRRQIGILAEFFQVAPGVFQFPAA